MNARFLEDADASFFSGRSLRELTYSETFGVALARVDFLAVAPIGVVLLLTLLALDIGRNLAASRHGVKLRSGLCIPWLSVGCLDRTWSVEGLLPSREAKAEIILGGRLAALAVAVLAIAVGFAHGGLADSPLLCNPTRLPLAVLQLLGKSFPEDKTLDIVGLDSASLVAAPSGIDALIPVDPILFAGSLALTSQAIGLLPLGGMDGYELARFMFGPRPARILELVAGILLVIGAVGRLGPSADPDLCLGAFLTWAVSALSARETPLPPREDCEDTTAQRPLAFAAGALLLVSAAVLLPGRLMAYGVMSPPDL
mmetsp:Transcript_95871/g.310767  ORF Transcript_95871/g.310767 Transcript_95871/m.310767 type:complete len:313 (+) Transcript_95871:1432-2370(+)